MPRGRAKSAGDNDSGGARERLRSPLFNRGKSGRALPKLGRVPNVGAILDDVVDCGGAVFIASTRAGKALSVTVRDGDSEVREWPRDQDELDELFELIGRTFDPDQDILADGTRALRKPVPAPVDT